MPSFCEIPVSCAFALSYIDLAPICCTDFCSDTFSASSANRGMVMLVYDLFSPCSLQNNVDNFSALSSWIISLASRRGSVGNTISMRMSLAAYAIDTVCADSSASW